MSFKRKIARKQGYSGRVCRICGKVLNEKPKKRKVSYKLCFICRLKQEFNL